MNRTAVHEAGHAVAARALGFKLIGLQVAGGGRCVVVPPKSRPPATIAGQLATVLFAGRAAERELLGGRGPGGGCLDDRMIEQLAGLVWGPNVDLARHWLRSSRASALATVESQADRVEELAGLIERYGKLSGERVAQLMGGDW